MKTRIVYTKIFKDGYYSSLDHLEKNAFIYLLFNERVNLSGIYELSDREKCFDLNITQDELFEVKKKFTTDGKFNFIDDWVIVINHDRYNNYTGKLNEVAKDKELELLPEKICHAIGYQRGIDRVSKGYVYPCDSLNNHKSETINKKSVIRNKESEVGTPSETTRGFFNNVVNKTDEFHLFVQGIAQKNKIPPESVRTEVLKFTNYWTELNKSGTKERWELEKTFEVNRRLATWFSRVKEFNRVKEAKGITI